MKILVTGFEPFGGAAVNASWEAIRLLPNTIGGAAIVKRQLPVVFGEAGRLACAAAAESGADVLVCVGVAGGRKAVTPELVAVNWRMASIADNAGQAYHGEMIDAAAPAARMTSLPVMRLVDAAKAADVPCQLSLTAGGYVCNDLYWAILTDGETSGRPGLFVHVPDLDALDTAATARGLEAILSVIASA